MACQATNYDRQYQYWVCFLRLELSATTLVGAMADQFAPYHRLMLLRRLLFEFDKFQEAIIYFDPIFNHREQFGPRPSKEAYAAMFRPRLDSFLNRAEVMRPVRRPDHAEEEHVREAFLAYIEHMGSRWDFSSAGERSRWVRDLFNILRRMTIITER